jgi:threonine dehydratase
MSIASPRILRIAADVQAARLRIGDKVARTPCLASRRSEGLWFKTENFQHTGSFKLRGAMSKLTTLSTETDVITASSGNHGIACSHAALTTGHRLTVVLPEMVAKAKLEKIQSYGTKTILQPGDSGKAEQHARAMAQHGDYVYVSPYNDPMVMAGQGTIGLELLEQLPQIDNVFISLGGGGLVSGVGAAIKAVSPNTRIVGVSAINSAALAASIVAGKVVETEHLKTLADGCAGGVDDDALTLPVASEVIDDLVYCSEEQIAEALRILAWQENMIVEGAAGLALAGYLSDPGYKSNQVSVILLCGANYDAQVIKPIIAARQAE